MIYDLDATMYLTPTCYGRNTLIATLEQRENLLSVLSAYRTDSLKDGYASPMPDKVSKNRDRTRAMQLWNHGVLNQATLALTFGVNRRTLSHYWGTYGTRPGPRLYGRINPDHCEFLIELLQHHHRREPIPLTDDSSLSILCGDPDSRLHTNLSAAANLLGITRHGQPMICVGLTDTAPAPPIPQPLVEPTRAVPLDRLPHTESEPEEVVTNITDADTRDAVESGQVPYAPKVDFDDTGDSLLAELEDDEIADLGVDEDHHEDEDHPHDPSEAEEEEEPEGAEPLQQDVPAHDQE